MTRSPALPLLACVTFALLVTSTPAEAGEGQWKPDQLSKIEDRAKTAGLELDAGALWDPSGDERTGGLMRASINLGGCSAAFISPDGLIATNHHCAYGALQANSSVEHDYLADGFLAADHGSELRAEGKSVKLLRSIEDVTEKVQAVLDAAEDDRARAKAYDRIRNELVDACESGGEFRSCRVASFFDNSKFELHEYVELRDIRLVYAPPAAIGEYGGEIDNWMWPRHTGDFSLLRAYAGTDNEPTEYAETNVPYKPGQYLVPSAEGVNEGDFVGILGYPGRTHRYLWATEIERHHKQWLPMRVGIYGEWIELLEAAAARDEAVGIKVAAFKKSLANRHKNAAGKIAGLDRLKFTDSRTQEDARLRSSDEGKATLDALDAITNARRDRAARQFLLDNLRYAPRSLAIARTLATWAEERGKQDDVERKAGYRDRDEDRVWNRLTGLVRDYDAQTDVELLASFLAYADGLEGERIAGFDGIMGAAKGNGGYGPKRDGVTGPPQPYLDAAKAALAKSKLADEKALRELFDDPKKVKASKDPMFNVARALIADVDALAEIKDAERGQLLKLTPAYFELIGKMRGNELYSDANGTLRMSYANIQGYDKWDGKTQEPQTTLSQAVAKHKDADPFDLPDHVLEGAKTSTESRWIDAELGDVPIAFLSDGDTTGGNSGSPVVDSKGRLVGFNFDRTWENVAGDYVWRTIQSRNITADVRFMYWMLEVEGADHLLEELGVADHVKPVIAPAPAADETKAAGKDAKAEPKSVGRPQGPCGCVTDEDGSGSGRGFLGLGLLGLLAFVRRRRVD